ncbi:MAG TPA: phosphatidylserine decarboxylase [Vicinamibacterales bacterium]|nr:phosphatidylserine decarboxylase [Vicinamibacterales bacterium]
MRIDPAGWPFVLGGFILALIVSAVASQLFGALLLLLPLFFLFFFRDPNRVIDAPATAVLSPADGRVMVAGEPTAQGFPKSAWHQISIFLSPMDVHVNRMPVGGRILSVRYHPGRFLPAYRHDATELNEYTEVVVEQAGYRVVVRQIVGVLARRIVCRVKAGDTVRAGDRFGVMKFGSRMDVFLPRDSTLLTRVGDRVTGGITRLAELPAQVRPMMEQPESADTPVVTVEA